jgi:aspartate/methionine/tyrosine aminotransferase
VISFEPYPFEKMRDLLEGLEPKNSLKLLNLSIGEPQFPTPQIILDELRRNEKLFAKYPTSAGEARLREAQRGFIRRRFSLELTNEECLPTLGTREALFNFPQFLLFSRENALIAHPNPFYQIYEGAAKMCRAEQILLELREENGFLPDPADPRLAACDLVILNSPNNPTGAVMSLETLKIWARLAAKHGFVLLNDECYSEIYRGEKPPSLLEAARAIGNDKFKNIIVMNSLSKRSSAAGVRSGFAAGDSEILRGYARYRSYAGCAAGVPLQLAAAAAWEDDFHAEQIRQKYAANLVLAEEILGIKAPEAAFYLWLKVTDDQAAARELFVNYAIRALCGSFLSRLSGDRSFLRGDSSDHRAAHNRAAKNDSFFDRKSRESKYESDRAAEKNSYDPRGGHNRAAAENSSFDRANSDRSVHCPVHTSNLAVRCANLDHASQKHQYLRLALVYEQDETTEALTRLKEFLSHSKFAA